MSTFLLRATTTLASSQSVLLVGGTTYTNGALRAGSTRVTQYVYVQLTDGTPATGLTHLTAGLTARYMRVGAAPVAVALQLATPTAAWTAGRFCEVAASLCPGLYRIDYPDAAFAAGSAESVELVLKGTGLRTVKVTVPLGLSTQVWGAKALAGGSVTSVPTTGLPTMTAGQLNRRLLQVLTGPAAGERVLIVGQSNTNVLQVAPPLTVALGVGDQVVVL